MGAPRRWGWHRLDPTWAEHLVASAALPRRATVLDVGAGHGAVTKPLVAAGLKVIAVEAHHRRADVLRERFGSTITVVETDASTLRLPRHPFHVVSSPPFAITTPLLRRLLQPGSRMVSTRLVLQEQAAIRWSSPAAPAFARWHRTFHARLGERIPRSAFDPPPPVPCRVLILERR